MFNENTAVHPLGMYCHLLTLSLDDCCQAGAEQTQTEEESYLPRDRRSTGSQINSIRSSATFPLMTKVLIAEVNEEHINKWRRKKRKRERRRAMRWVVQHCPHILNMVV
ncbi:unnamed protein product [Pleuronectes platessa]|uniref:Uncharacterized protein n=1 Tax=Pleuronectes platessa TaxID=8262 RepID=A0A9N7YFS5_PLEPL|nr:unnamed protein product [Pleuronectes platessa]